MGRPEYRAARAGTGEGGTEELDDMYDALKDDMVDVKDENEDLREENLDLKRNVGVLEREVESGVKRFGGYKESVRALGNEM
jgi:cell division septum initiation protein DivIVA